MTCDSRVVNFKDISFAKYEEILVNAVKDILEILGYNIDNDLLLFKNKINRYSYFKRKKNSWLIVSIEAAYWCCE